MSDMKAGRELNALVAEKVMGYQWRKFNSRRSNLCSPDGDLVVIKEGLKITYTGYLKPTLPAFSTDIAAAWQVVGHIIALAEAAMDQPYFELRTCGSYWSAVFDSEEMGTRVSEDADTAPLAICRAALKAVESTQ